MLDIDDFGFLAHKLTLSPISQLSSKLVASARSP